MDYAIIGGDKRFVHLAHKLKNLGKNTRVFFQNSEGNLDIYCTDEKEISNAKNVIMNYPPKTNINVDYETLLSEVSDQAKIYLCGPEMPQSCPIGKRIINLWEDEALLLENAYLTAEGATVAAMQTSERIIKGARCLIIGWGRIGKALTEILVGMGAYVTVASRKIENMNKAVERGAEAVYLQDIARILPEQDVIFVTPPHMVLEETNMKYVNENALVIDLASAPYGVKLSEAWNRGIRAWREPGLPGRYCPESGAEVLLKALIRAKGGVENV